MKSFAKLMLVFSISFLAIFLLSTVFRFLALRIDWAKRLPVKPETALTLIISAAHWALSLSLFTSLLFALKYSVRQGYLTVMTLAVLIPLSFVYSFGVSALLNSIKAVPPSQTEGVPLGEKGIILSGALNRDETAIILLNGSKEPLGPRVMSVPGRPLAYFQYASAFSGAVELPPVPFGDDTPWFLKSLAVDLKLNGEILRQRFSEGFGSFLTYSGALIFVLCSIGLAIKFSAWPLANLFIGILAFRGVLALEVFLSSMEMQKTFESFFNGALPVSFAIPAIYLLIGALLQVYSLLSYLIKRQYDDD